MDYVGLFCLGAFVGTLASLGVRRVQDVNTALTQLAAVLPAVLSGAVILMTHHFQTAPAFGCYPMGLAVALLWAFAGTAVEHLKSDSRAMKAVGAAHLFGSIVGTLLAAAIVLPPAYMQIRAELTIDGVDRAKWLRAQWSDATKCPEASPQSTDAEPTTAQRPQGPAG